MIEFSRLRSDKLHAMIRVATERERTELLERTKTPPASGVFYHSVMPSALEKVLGKYEWAKQHVNQLESAIDEFRRSNPHSIGTERNIERDEITYRVIMVPPIPDRIGFMLGMLFTIFVAPSIIWRGRW